MAAAPGRDQRGPMERLVRIAAVLRVAGEDGVSTRRLIQVGEYQGASVEDLLGRDLRALRKQGWEIVNTGGAGSDGHYRMVTVDNRLRVRLSPSQLRALRRAVLVVDREDLATRLGLPESERPADLLASLPVSGPDPRLRTVAHGLRHRCLLRFRYAGRDRVVIAEAIRTQFGTWYLLGREEGSDVLKYFVVSRMGQVSSDEPGTAGETTAVRQPSLHPMAWEVDPPIEVTLRADPAYARDVERWLGQPDRREDGPAGVDLVYRVTHRAGLRARLYALGVRVHVLGPEEVRREVLDDLTARASDSPVRAPA